MLVKIKKTACIKRRNDMNILDKIKNDRIYFDGAMGTMLQNCGLKAGELPELWNITHPEEITKIHSAYLSAGCDIIKTNTFGANSLKFDDNLEQIISAAVNCAKAAISANSSGYVALDIGPLGKLLKPLGELDFEEAVEIFARTVNAGKAGVDLILIETMNDSYETKAAVLAAKENSSLPVFVTNAYDENGKLMTGADAIAMIAMLEGLGVDALGMNCGLGANQAKKVVSVLCEYASVPVIINPNAGIPHIEQGVTVFDEAPESFAENMSEIVNMGARIIGGCCGTTPEHIKALIKNTRTIPVKPIEKKTHTLVSSYTHAVEIGNKPVLIGERINPTGKPKLKSALRENNIEYILNEVVSQQEAGAHILDVNVGLPEIDEIQMMCDTVAAVQSVVDLPLQIDTSNADAMEKAMRLYNGKPLVNSVNGKVESMEAVFPLVKKYGGTVIALTLDENGIPEDADGRIKIAEKICDYAEKYGIDKKDIVVDTLAMAVSSDKNAAKTTLEAVKGIKKLGLKTSLGVSNISFGLPNRDYVTSAFFAQALSYGLDAAIMNPHSAEMMKIYYSFMALNGFDENCSRYIEFAQNTVTSTTVSDIQKKSENVDTLKNAVIKGLKENAAQFTAEYLKTKAPIEIIDGEIIPALDVVGKGFEEKTMFLPQLLMSAEAAKSAFDIIKHELSKTGKNETKGKIVLATVKGDIHDIGKNIVKVLLENYGFEVIDLGKDVPPKEVVAACQKNDVKLVGLSALMTTTVVSMEETIKLLKKNIPDCKTIVGGAVLTKEYADMIGADYYGKDAMQTVRIAEEFFNK